MWMVSLPIVGYTSVVVLDIDDDSNLDPHIVEGRRVAQANTDFEADF